MKLSTILDHIDSGHIALPEFQRGYVWNRDQVRGLMDSLYKRHPVGSLLVWATESQGATHRGDGDLAPGVVKLLLDGQQRITSLYGIIRERPPKFFDGQSRMFTGLHFHLDDERFAFYQPSKMKGDPLWIDVSALAKDGPDGLGGHLERLSKLAETAARVGDYVGRLTKILGIQDIDFHVEEVTGADKSIDIVVDIFNRVNSGGTKLSQGDLALAKICGDWPEGRERMKGILGRWRKQGYRFSMDWLLRSVNTIVTGEAKFVHLHDRPPDAIQEGIARAEKAIDTLLNLIDARFGLDHDRVLLGRYALPVLVHYLDRRGGHFEGTKEQDKALFWYLQSAMWGRFSGSTETIIDQNLRLLEELDNGLDRIIDELRLWHGSLRVVPAHFAGHSKGARFYPILYLLTRVGQAQDWRLGVPLKKHMMGKMSGLDMHHIFPKAMLKKHGVRQSERNAIANFCFQTKDTNLWIGAKPPTQYFPEVEAKCPGALASQWIPMEERLWEVENYHEFLEARRELLAAAANEFLQELAHGADLGIETEDAEAAATIDVSADVPGGFETDEEEAALQEINAWVVQQGLPEGELLFELADPDTGQALAILDLAWPEGLQEGLSDPVAVLLNEGKATLSAANDAGYRYFTTIEGLKNHVLTQVVGAEERSQAVG